MILRIVRESAAAYGEVVGVRESRGRAACLLRGLRGSAALRDRLNHAETVGEFTDLLDGFFRDEPEDVGGEDAPDLTGEVFD